MENKDFIYFIFYCNELKILIEMWHCEKVLKRNWQHANATIATHSNSQIEIAYNLNEI